MLTVLMAATPDVGMVSTMLPVLEAFVRRGHRVVFLGERAVRDEVERRGGVFVEIMATSDAPTPRRSTRGGPDPDDGRAAAPSRFLPGIQQVDAIVRGRLLDPLPQQWATTQAVLNADEVDVIVSDPTFMGAAAVTLLPRSERPAVIMLGGFPLPFPEPGIAPYGLGLQPNADLVHRVRNAALRFLSSQILLRRVVGDLNRAMLELTGHRVRGDLFDAPRRADAWAQLTVPRFEYPRARRHPNLHFVGPLRPLERGELPAWWDYSDSRPLVALRCEPGTALEDLVIPAIAGLQDEDVLLVVTGVEESAVVAARGRRLPANVRVEPAIPYSHLFATARVSIGCGDYAATHTALRWGVPLVVAGTAESQVETNARVAWSGVGVDLRTARPSAEALRDAVLQVLANPAMRAAASRIAAQIASADAENALCSLAETLTDHRREASAARRDDLPIA